jgi:hypothetical protein
MMNKLFLGACLALAVAGCASTPATKAPATAAAKAPPGCVPETASRIPQKDSACAGFGRTWTGTDLQRTGQQDVGQALKMLDPSITVQGH